MCYVVVGVREPERGQHERGIEWRQRGNEPVGEHGRCDGTIAGVVGVLDEIEMHRCRVDDVSAA